MNESIEAELSGREKLQNLEASGKYLFHGSEDPNIDSFEPRQAHNYRDGIQEPDGEPAVFASDKADYAILMALVNKKNCPKGYKSSAGTVNDKEGNIVLQLSAKKSALDQLTDESFGYVYIFDKDAFVKRPERRVKYKSIIPVSSTDKVRVTKADLPPYVEIFD